MAAKKASGESIQLGDRVQVRYIPAWRGRIVELRGPLGPGGAQVYRIRIPNKPKPIYTELLADQLILIPSETK
jgi:hypothetical protein